MKWPWLYLVLGRCCHIYLIFFPLLFYRSLVLGRFEGFGLLKDTGTRLRFTIHGGNFPLGMYNSPCITEFSRAADGQNVSDPLSSCSEGL
jgi:hypothetical protein